MTAQIKERSLEVFNSKCSMHCHSCQDYLLSKYSLEFEAEPIFDFVKLQFSSKDQMIEMLEWFIKIIREAE